MQGKNVSCDEEYPILLFDDGLLLIGDQLFTKNEKLGDDILKECIDNAQPILLPRLCPNIFCEGECAPKIFFWDKLSEWVKSTHPTCKFDYIYGFDIYVNEYRIDFCVYAYDTVIEEEYDVLSHSFDESTINVEFIIQRVATLVERGKEDIQTIHIHFYDPTNTEEYELEDPESVEITATYIKITGRYKNLNATGTFHPYLFYDDDIVAKFFKGEQK